MGIQGIGWAVKQLQNGSKVRRSGWNGKGQYLIFVPGSSIIVSEGRPLASVFQIGQIVNYRPHVDIVTVDGSVFPWNASQGDLLAIDYEIAE